jgi:hypothetical protein
MMYSLLFIVVAAKTTKNYWKYSVFGKMTPAVEVMRCLQVRALRIYHVLPPRGEYKLLYFACSSVSIGEMHLENSLKSQIKLYM